MRTLTPLRALFAVASAGLLLTAGDSWKTKDYRQWTDEDVQHVLNGSPWAGKMTISEGGPRRGGDLVPGAGGGRGGGGYGGGAGGAGGIGGGMPPIAGGGGYGRGRQNTGDESQQSRGGGGMEVIVRWASALPVKQAMLKMQAGDANAQPEPDRDYVVALFWPNKPGAGNWSSQHDASQMRDSLMEATHLDRKGKDPIAPEDIQFKSDETGRTTMFLFPRTSAIDLDNKEVVFATKMGSMKIEHKFKLKEMVYNGQLAL